MLFAKLFIMFRILNESLMNSAHIRSAAYLHNLKAFGLSMANGKGGVARGKGEWQK